MECSGSTANYDELDRLVSTTDARGVTITNTYDKIGRKKATYQGDEKTGTQLASWTYDTVAKGELYAVTRVRQWQQVRDPHAVPRRPVSTSGDPVRHPEGRHRQRDRGTDRFFTVYNTDGTVQSTSHPAVGGLPAEAVTYTYDALQRITRVAGKNTYATEMVYAQTGELLNAELNTGGRKAWATASYEQGTKRLLTSASLARPSSHRAGRPTAPRSTTSTRSTPTTRWVMSSRSRTPRRRGSATSSASSTTICAG